MSRSILSCLLALALPTASLFAGCVSTHGVLPALAVEASLSSVTLADDCPVATDGATGIRESDCAPGLTDCGYCRQTGLQIALVANDDGVEVPVEIVSVELLTEAGEHLENLTARSPRIYGEEGYDAWDETIAPGEDLHVTYDASAPTWSEVETGGYRYGARYLVRVVIRIDGEDRVIELSPVMREAEIVT